MKKNIKKAKSTQSKVTQENLIVRDKSKERRIPCGPGTILAIGQNRVAYKSINATTVRFQMSTMQENRCAMDVEFATGEEADFFLSYLSLWNKRQHFGEVIIKNDVDDVNILSVYLKDQDCPCYYPADSPKKLYKLFAAAAAMRDEYRNEAQKYDRFWFTIYEDESKGAALYGSTNVFDFKFKPGTAFTYVANVDDVTPGMDLH